MARTATTGAQVPCQSPDDLRPYLDGLGRTVPAETPTPPCPDCREIGTHRANCAVLN